MKRRDGSAKAPRMFKVFLALAGRHFGMSLQEIAEEAHIKERSVYRYIRTLEGCGVEIVRVWEPDNHGWHTLYRIKSVLGSKLELRRRVAP